MTPDRNHGLAPLEELEEALRGRPMTPGERADYQKMIYERSERMTTEASRNAWVEEAERQKEQKNVAYAERSKVLAAFAQTAVALGWKVGLGLHSKEDKSWKTDWRTILFIDLPTGQGSWHFPDSEAHLLEGLPQYDGKWDGHTTPEKYERLKALKVPKGWVSPEEHNQLRLAFEMLVQKAKVEWAENEKLREELRTQEIRLREQWQQGLEKYRAECQVELKLQIEKLRAQVETLGLELATLRMKAEVVTMVEVRDLELEALNKLGVENSQLRAELTKLVASLEQLEIPTLSGPSGIRAWEAFQSAKAALSKGGSK
jgi:hypothetical protein